MCAKAVLLGCAQDGGVPQTGCACRRCDYARCHPDYKDGMVACLGIVDNTERKVFVFDATPNFGSQLWALQNMDGQGGSEHPLELGGILLTHAHAGHYTGLLQLGKEGADMKRVPVFCTPSMASFLRCNQPWAQLTERGNISLREVDITGGSDAASVSLTPSISFLPVAVPHRAELSDTVAYVIVVSRSPNVASTVVTQPELASMASSRSRGEDSAHMMKLFYCPDTDGWSGWKRGIRDWCDDMDVALLDATFYDENELTGREMREVSHPCAQETMKELAGCKADVVLIHLNHTNPLLTFDSPERAEALAAGFKVGEFGMEWTLPVTKTAERIS